MQLDQNGHWSHLSDLPSKGALIECTTICDTCYLKWLLIRIWMILIYHNENVITPTRHNKYTYYTDISTSCIRVIIVHNYMTSPTFWYVNKVHSTHHTQGCINVIELQFWFFLFPLLNELPGPEITFGDTGTVSVGDQIRYALESDPGWSLCLVSHWSTSVQWPWWPPRLLEDSGDTYGRDLSVKE